MWPNIYLCLQKFVGIVSVQSVKLVIGVHLARKLRHIAILYDTIVHIRRVEEESDSFDI